MMFKNPQKSHSDNKVVTFFTQVRLLNNEIERGVKGSATRAARQ